MQNSSSYPEKHSRTVGNVSTTNDRFKAVGIKQEYLSYAGINLNGHTRNDQNNRLQKNGYLRNMRDANFMSFSQFDWPYRDK